MIELLVSVCLASGGGCRDVSLLYDARDVSVMACVTMGQVEIARWQEDHPGYRVRRWSCGVAGEGGKSI